MPETDREMLSDRYCPSSSHTWADTVAEAPVYPDMVPPDSRTE